MYPVPLRDGVVNGFELVPAIRVGASGGCSVGFEDDGDGKGDEGERADESEPMRVVDALVISDNRTDARLDDFVNLQKVYEVRRSTE